MPTDSADRAGSGPSDLTAASPGRSGDPRRRSCHVARGARPRPHVRAVVGAAAARGSGGDRSRPTASTSRRARRSRSPPPYQASFEGLSRLGPDAPTAAAVLTSVGRARPVRRRGVAGRRSVGRGVGRTLRRRARGRVGVPRRLRAVGPRAARVAPAAARGAGRGRRGRAGDGDVPCLAEAEALLAELPSTGASGWLSLTVSGGRTRAGERVEEAFEMAAEVDAVVAVGVNCSAPPRWASWSGRRGDHRQARGGIPEQWRTLGRRDAPLDRGRSFGPDDAASWVRDGARLVGGCCRVGPRCDQSAGSSVDGVVRLAGDRRRVRNAGRDRRARRRRSPSTASATTAATSKNTRPRSTTPRGNARYHGTPVTGLSSPRADQQSEPRERDDRRSTSAKFAESSRSRPRAGASGSRTARGRQRNATMLATRWIWPPVLGPTDQLCFGKITMTVRAATQMAPSSDAGGARGGPAAQHQRGQHGEGSECECDDGDVEHPAGLGQRVLAEGAAERRDLGGTRQPVEHADEHGSNGGAGDARPREQRRRGLMARRRGLRGWSDAASRRGPRRDRGARASDVVAVIHLSFDVRSVRIRGPKSARQRMNDTDGSCVGAMSARATGRPAERPVT